VTANAGAPQLPPKLTGDRDLADARLELRVTLDAIGWHAARFGAGGLAIERHVERAHALVDRMTKAYRHEIGFAFGIGAVLGVLVALLAVG
jgi:hypothetical protein